MSSDTKTEDLSSLGELAESTGSHAKRESSPQLESHPPENEEDAELKPETFAAQVLGCPELIQVSRSYITIISIEYEYWKATFV
ncbi:hypothetical protein BHYA_0151g00020 [Botrytis hyacinthi]|uniref:Uncharacterized protein n=1 Tax=Botrytis hyacinthi TaxID=278943 RepID=A0A4Z1GK52_9HELO|nr:hypothetical protein BHYA_0151g00020 [Botrytis hyacinthi]